jgi:hypothetical protein
MAITCTYHGQWWLYDKIPKSLTKLYAITPFAPRIKRKYLKATLKGQYEARACGCKILKALDELHVMMAPSNSAASLNSAYCMDSYKNMLLSMTGSNITCMAKPRVWR